MGLCRHLLHRLLGTLTVLWLVLTLTFIILRYVPGGPFDAERELPAEAAMVLQNSYGQGPILSQYGRYLSQVLQGNLGPSFRQSGWSVHELIATRWYVSFELGFYTMALACLGGIGLGCVLMLTRRKWLQRSCMRGCTLLLCVPAIILGPLLNYFLACRLHWFPSVGWYGWRSKVLPVLTLSPCYLAILTQITWQGMRTEYDRAYVRTARAKGLGEGQIFFHHVFANGIQPAIAYLGPVCAGVLSGTFVVENVFHIPGLGRLLMEAIADRDHTVIVGVVLLYALLISACNLLADILLAILNPRLRNS